MMDDEVSTATSPTPFTKTQPMGIRQDRGGNLPRPQVYYENKPKPNQSYDESIDYRPKGRPYPIERPYKFQGQASGQILNIAAHDPQLWNSVIDVWKYPVVVEVWKNIPQETDPETMYKYLETFLGESTRALWESYKTNFRENYNDMLKLGANPYNFVNQITSLITGEDPNSGHLTIQQEALLYLEQMQIKDWKYIKEFYQSYYHFCAISRNGFNQELGEKLFRKLPGTLGREIETSWRELKGVQQDDMTENQGPWSIGHRINHIMKILKRKCSEIQTQRQLKKSQYRFCKNIFTPQTYGMEENIKEKNTKKIYYLSRKTYDSTTSKQKL